MCAQRGLRSARASTQSDQSFRCPHEETLGPQLPTERKRDSDWANVQADLSLPWAHRSFCWVMSGCGSITHIRVCIKCPVRPSTTQPMEPNLLIKYPQRRLIRLPRQADLSPSWACMPVCNFSWPRFDHQKQLLTKYYHISYANKATESICLSIIGNKICGFCLCSLFEFGRYIYIIILHNHIWTNSI